MPGSLVVLGGGAIGVELGQVFARFGSRVTVVEARTGCFPRRSPRPGTCWPRVFGRGGHRGAHRASMPPGSDMTGPASRSPSTAAASSPARRCSSPPAAATELGEVGVDAVGIDENLSAIPVDDRLRAAAGVWALGDITGKGAFTHMAMYQAGIVVADILGGPASRREYHARAQGHLHRSGDRRRRADRGSRPGTGGCDVRVGRPRSRSPPGAGSTRRATRASSSWSRTPARGCWSGPPSRARPAARCSARS